MRIASADGRAIVIAGAHALDIHNATRGRFSPEPRAVFARWAEVQAWARGIDVAGHPDAFHADEKRFGPPSPDPRQIFAIGLNYRDHAAEIGMPAPVDPVVFTKFASSLVGPIADVALPGDQVDGEAELVVVIGAGGRDIRRTEALTRVAGFTVGQDLSERGIQMRGTPAQFSLGKSFAGFSPVGPCVVSLDELPNPDALTIRSVLLTADGTSEVLQEGSTSDMVFSVSELVHRLSHVIELLPGDLIFTGTPAGVGMSRRPPRYLAPDETLITEIDGVGRIVQMFH